MNLISVVLSGGAGTRLWPESRKAMPKPFMDVGGSTLLAQTLMRGHACGAANTVIVTNQDYLFLTSDVAQSLEADQLPPIDYLLEPAGRNTAPAIALAALQCAEQYGDDAVMLVLAADHLIPDTEAFVAGVRLAAAAAVVGQLVVFGVVPTSPETGFGYIEVSKPSAGVQGVMRFVEKPNAATAMQYLQTGRYYWNSGMFCFTAKTILAAFALHAPAVMKAAQVAWDARQVSPATAAIAPGSSAASTPTNGSITRFEAASFSALPDISIDYAVMEPASQVPNAVTVVPSSFRWSDVGSWPAIADAHVADDQGNTFLHDVVASHTSGTHVQVQSHGPKVVATIGIENLIIVDTPDALLVAHKSSAQHIKHVVDTLKTRHIDTAAHQTTQLPATVHRPWGTYASLKEEPGYKVKRITVKPGQSLSLQYHHQRAEHWVVVQGLALIQVGEEQFATLAGGYRYIPLKEKHRLTNTGVDELVLIEVQCGNYLGEDDIVRLADTYGRA